jgi:hypothetical protein
MAHRRFVPNHLRRVLIGALVVLATGGLAACDGDDDSAVSGGGGSPPGTTVAYVVGDGADGSEPAAELADYIRGQAPDRFFYLGDVYETGTPAEFERNYEPLYGALADRTDPVIGNHEYGNREEGYYPYWMARRGWGRERANHRAYVDPESDWQVIAYSSESPPDAEAKWVSKQIAKHSGTCRIALTHRTRYSVGDGEHLDNPDQEPIWRVLAGTTAINIAGNAHVYARLRPISGVHVIISGTGGHKLRELAEQLHPLAAAADEIPMATRLELRRGEANITQVDAGGGVYDSTTITCEPAREE